MNYYLEERGWLKRRMKMSRLTDIKIRKRWILAMLLTVVVVCIGIFMANAIRG